MEYLKDLGKGIKAGIINITPEQAKTMLSRNTKNRVINQKRVTHYASEMLNGKWMLNGDTIRFDYLNNLIDGQHRLHAIITANVSIECIIITGLESEAFKNIDTGKNRSAKDVLSVVIDGKEQSGFAATLIKNIIFNSKKAYVSNQSMRDKAPGTVEGTSGRNVITNELVVEYYRNNKELIDDIISFMSPLRHRTIKLLHFSTLTYLFYTIRKKNVVYAEDFMQKLVFGSGLMDDDPIFQLRERLISYKTSEVKQPNWHYPVIFYKCWNAYRRGEKMTRLRIYENDREKQILPI